MIVGATPRVEIHSNVFEKSGAAVSHVENYAQADGKKRRPTVGKSIIR